VVGPLKDSERGDHIAGTQATHPQSLERAWAEDFLSLAVAGGQGLAQAACSRRRVGLVARDVVGDLLLGEGFELALKAAQLRVRVALPAGRGNRVLHEARSQVGVAHLGRCATSSAAASTLHADASVELHGRGSAIPERSCALKFVGMPVDPCTGLLQHDLASEDVGVEGAGPSNTPHGDEVGDEQALWGRKRDGGVLA
jgi:hypothetical protein